jgi:CCR4-NOT transcription complex subunit 7/8
MFAQDSIDLLVRSGLNFEEHEARGIEVDIFGELLMCARAPVAARGGVTTRLFLGECLAEWSPPARPPAPRRTSGIILSDDTKWLSFHSGYDFGYMLRILRCDTLPAHEDDFFELLQLFFPSMYDIKYIIKYCEGLPGAENLKGGLNRVAEALSVERIGQMHQAGSDSLITSSTFFRIEALFKQLCEAPQNRRQPLDEGCCGVIYGLGVGGRHDQMQDGAPIDNTQ